MTNKLDKLKVGIVGSGVFGGYHASKYINHEDVVLCGIYDLDYSRAQKLADQMNQAANSTDGIDGTGGTDDTDTEAYNNYEKFIENMDMVVIATPAVTHFDLAMYAISNKKHCLVEKPLAIYSDHATLLVNEAKKNSVVLQVGHQERYVLEAMGLLPFKYPVKEISCKRIGPYSGRGSDVSVVYDLMIHDIDLARRLTDSPLDRLECDFSYLDQNIEKINADEAFAHLLLKDGTKLNFQASRMATHQERSVKILLENGSIFIDFLSRKIVDETDIEIKSFEEIANLPAIKDPLGMGASSFIKAVKNNEEPVVTGKQGRDAVYWAQLIHEQRTKLENE